MAALMGTEFAQSIAFLLTKSFEPLFCVFVAAYTAVLLAKLAEQTKHTSYADLMQATYGMKGVCKPLLPSSSLPHFPITTSERLLAAWTDLTQALIILANAGALIAYIILIADFGEAVLK
jgi:hypothetical protein